MVKKVKTVAEMLEEMNSIALENLTNPIHREFVNDTLIEARKCEAVTTDLPAQLAALEEAYAEEMQASLIEEKVQGLTQEVRDLSAERGLAQTALKSALRGVMGMSDAQKVAAATALFELMHKYDLHTGQNVDEQTAVIDSFVLDVEENHAGEMELTGMVELYDALKAKNKAVCDKVIERDEAKVGLGTGRMANARLETDKAWRELRRAVNAFAYVNDYAAYKHFIGYMNVLIVRYKRVHLDQTVSSPEAGDGAAAPDTPNTPSTPDTPSEGETMHTVNWVNKDGETVKTMQVATGTKLTSSDYPKASSGYIWKPSWIGGGLTVNGDTTIREEPDDDLGV